MHLSTYLREQEERKEKAKNTLIGYCIAPFILGWVLLWYNYVWIQWPLGYWTCVGFGLALLFTPNWLSKPVCGIVGTVAIFAQIAKWSGLIILPLIK